MKKALQAGMLAVSIALNVFGLISLVHVSGIAPISGMAFYDSFNLIVKYVFVIVSMAAGILLFTAFAGTFKGKLKNGLSIGGCVYSSILTLPLVYVFIGCFFTANGAQLPMVNEVSDAFIQLLGTDWLLYFIFVLGTLMSIVFLAVPIVSTVFTVKGINPFAKKKK